ncbi:MAG: transporter substrate-binding domain-containing protein [Alphaproteobacteria bacterium]|nr:transporter substrate-binding domain-containing protein [Alphaproteobacteria bacterium]
MRHAVAVFLCRGLLARNFVVGAVMMIAALGQAEGQTLEAIRSAHQMSCGTIASTDDWNGIDIHGNLSAFEADVCRAVATAILGNDASLTVQTFPAEPEALNAVKRGAVQLVVGVSPAASTAEHFGIAFGPAVFYDPQRVMVSKQSGIRDLAGLRDKLICALDSSPTERVLRDEMTARGIPYALVAHSEQGEMDAALAVRKCAGTGTMSRLAQSRANFRGRDDFVFLPERFGLNPVVPAYRYGDQKFGLLVEWTISALIEAEALGITRANVETARQRQDVRAEQLLGHDFATAQALGLAPDWAARVIATTGNYGEIFQRCMGPYHLDRELNDLWTHGGLMYPQPMR